MGLKQFAAALAICLLAPGCAEPDFEIDAEDPDDFRVQWDGMFDHFEYVREDSNVARATGSIQESFRDQAGNPMTAHGFPFRSTCGITFISPHYAVTAAHCVNETDPQTETATVEIYDISEASLFALWAATYVEGTFPDFERIALVEDFSTYDVERYECSIVSRCGSGVHNCSFSADIALVHCPGRSSNAPWIPVASSDPVSGPVEMYWPHEVLSIPTREPTPPSASASDAAWEAYDEELDHYEHYTLYNSAERDENHHYLGGSANALLPLRSVDWPSEKGGGPRERLSGIDAVGRVISTDLFGCHGTSGSGVFQRNASDNLEYLGPVSTGASWAEDRLCNDPYAAMPGDVGLRYTSSASTRQLQSNFWLILFLDRLQPVVYYPWPTPPAYPTW